MRIRKISVVALVAVAAGLSLTACDGSGSNDSSTGAGSSPSAVATQGGSGSSGSTAVPQASTSVNGQGVAATGHSGSGSDGSGTAGSGACQTANLSFSHSSGMGEGEVLINLTNHGAGTCTMHGFPGVDLKGQDGTVSAARSHLSVPDVTLTSGQSTHFTLYFPPNNTGGSGVTFTSLVVTPPNETHSHTMDLAINVPAGDGAGPAITVDPVGAGK